MCGRYAIARDAQQIADAFNVDLIASAWDPVYHLAPTNRVPIIREFLDDGRLLRSLDLAIWDFKPPWSTPEKEASLKAAGKRVPTRINSMLDQLNVNRLWIPAFASQRAIVPMSGYFEWVDGSDGGRQPYYLHATDSDHQEMILGAAAIYSSRQQSDGTWSYTVSIVTREGIDTSGEIHDRMPTFLNEDAVNRWLAPGKLDKTEREDLAQFAESESAQFGPLISVYPVGRGINNSRAVTDRTDPDIVSEIALP